MVDATAADVWVAKVAEADTTADGAQTPERGMDRFGSCFDLEESIGLADATRSTASVSSGKADDPDSTPTPKVRKKPSKPVPAPASRNKMPQRSSSEPRSGSKVKARNAATTAAAAAPASKGRQPTKSNTLERARPTASEREASVVEEVAERGEKSVESRILQRINAKKAAEVRSPTPSASRIVAEAIASEPTVAAATAMTNTQRAKSAERRRRRTNTERDALEGQIVEGAASSASSSTSSGTSKERRK